MLILLVCFIAVAQERRDWREWEVYRAEHSETAALEATGPDLTWTSVTPRGNARLFVSNHPEGIGRPQDSQRPEDTRWPPREMEGKLWMDEVTAEDAVNYRLFAYHQNWFDEAICIGVVVENLSPENRLAVSGEQVGLAVGASENNPLGLDNLTVIGKRNAYAEFTNALFMPTPTLLLDPAPAPDAGTPGIRERLAHVWIIGGGSTFGARMRLYLRKVIGDPGPLRARVSTVWAWRQQTLTTSLPLIPANGPHVRGSWPVAEIRLDNAGDPFDTGRNERHTDAVRWLWLCRPIIDDKGNKTYRDDVYFTAERSFNPMQAKTNNGSYGASTVMRITVTNSANTDERVGIYLRYPHKTLPGVYVGAAATSVYDEHLQAWMPDDARGVELANWTYTDRATNRVTFRDWRWTTKALATYPVPAGATRVIPLTVTHDGPAMLPLAVVLRKEPKLQTPPPLRPGVSPAD